MIDLAPDDVVAMPDSRLAARLERLDPAAHRVELLTDLSDARLAQSQFEREQRFAIQACR